MLFKSVRGSLILWKENLNSDGQQLSQCFRLKYDNKMKN
jgi:hypothetical protein